MRSKLTNERTGEKHDWSKHEQDVIHWQIIGPNLQPGELAARAEQAEKRWDARVGERRSITHRRIHQSSRWDKLDGQVDVALPKELSTKVQWDLVHGFSLNCAILMERRFV